jgi:acetyl-CoA C-acetyltransferase
MATIVKSTEIPAPPEEVWEVISDPGRSEEWQTIHAGYPDGTPGKLDANSEFRQKVKIMGMPGEVKWKVTEADQPNRLALQGEGPMGTTLSTVFVIDGQNGSTNFTYETEFGGAALAPMASALEKESEKAAQESMEKLKALFA